MPQTKPIEMDPDMTDKEKFEYSKSQEKDYKRRIERARKCYILFSFSRPDEKNEGGIIVEIKLKEREPKSIQSGALFQGVVDVQHCHFFSPQDDLAFRLEYVHPYLDGVYNPRNRALRASCFNSRELSPVFTGGPGVDEIPAIWVDRAGLMANITDLKQVEEGAGKSTPPVLVLHGHYGGCIGYLPSYDTFTLGGTYSVRGYNMGELSAARNILELGADICVPVKKTHVYAFAEHGNDLGSSKDVKGSPTEVYRRMGHGSSYGVGVKLGLVRAEYAVDHNTGTGSVFFRSGERY